MKAVDKLRVLAALSSISEIYDLYGEETVDAFIESAPKDSEEFHQFVEELKQQAVEQES